MSNVLKELGMQLRKIDRTTGRMQMQNEILKWGVANKAALGPELCESLIHYVTHALEELGKERV